MSTQHITIVGMGRIGGALQVAFEEAGVQVTPVRRAGEAALADAQPGPIVVATRVGDLKGVVAALPPARRADVVLLQNGDLPQVARGLGLADATLGVLWVAVATRGATPLPGRSTALTGRHAEAVAAAMSAGGVPAHEVDAATFREEVALKLLWLCVVPVIAALRGSSVGRACAEHQGEITSLVTELTPIVSDHYGVGLNPERAARIVVEYTESIPHFPGGVKELEARNALLLRWGRQQGRAQPLHEALLEGVGALQQAALLAST